MTAENQQPIDNQEELNTHESNEQPIAEEQNEAQEAAAENTEEAPAEEVSEVDALKAELEDQKDKYLRLAAEFDNYRKRTMKEKSELILNGGKKCIESILPVVDDFERALSNMEKATDVDAVKEGVALIYNKFTASLAQNGVKKIEATGQPLDTDFHEAIAVIPAPTEEQKGKIIDCVQTGYMLNDTVLRHAKVVVGE
jgi:molecular chaperone GrpE